MPVLTDRAELRRRHGMWRFRPFLPLTPAETPVSLGEGDTPLLHVRRLGKSLGVDSLWIKDEGANPTGSFKARGLSAAITRAHAAGVTRFVIPTAGNAGIAAAAYAARAGCHVKVFAPVTTPAPILAQIRVFNGDLVLLDGHIGDCGRAARAYAAETGAFDLSTLREPYRIEGKKTLGLELALQFGWAFPQVIIYPTGGGTGLIGMWKALNSAPPAGSRMNAANVHRSGGGCAPIVRAFDAGSDQARTVNNPETIASGLAFRVRWAIASSFAPSGRARGRGRGNRRRLARWAADGAAQEGIDFA
jgi:threonine synthase